MALVRAVLCPALYYYYHYYSHYYCYYYYCQAIGQTNFVHSFWPAECALLVEVGTCTVACEFRLNGARMPMNDYEYERQMKRISATKWWVGEGVG